MSAAGGRHGWHGVLHVGPVKGRFDAQGVTAMREPTILAETIAGIEEILAGDLDQICVERAAIGLFFIGVKLNTGAAGACATPLRSISGGGLLPEFHHGHAIPRQTARPARPRLAQRD